MKYATIQKELESPAIRAVDDGKLKSYFKKPGFLVFSSYELGQFKCIKHKP